MSFPYGRKIVYIFKVYWIEEDLIFLCTAKTQTFRFPAVNVYNTSSTLMHRPPVVHLLTNKDVFFRFLLNMNGKHPDFSLHKHICSTHDDFPLPVAPIMALRPGFMIPLRERATKILSAVNL